jgi:hypothetical protein
MMEMNKFWKLSIVLFAVGTLSACGNQGEKKSSDSTQDSSETNIKTAENDAKTVLSYIYEGKVDGVEKVTNQTADENDEYLISKLVKGQEEMFEANGNENDYYLNIDGSDYYADDIIDDYANVYLEKTKEIGYDSDIKVEEVNEDEVTVTATITPIAGLSEAHPIGQARTELFGGLDEEEFIRKSQNKDVKTIQSLITLKLYAMYYGDMANSPEKSPETKEVSFTMEKENNHYTVDEDVLNQLAKESRDQNYADSTSTTESTDTIDSSMVDDSF